MKIEIRKVVDYDGYAQTPENAVLGDPDPDFGEHALCTVLDDRVEVLGVFAGNQAEVCRDLILKLIPSEATAMPVIFIGPCKHDPRTGRHEIYDGDEVMLCEWAVFQTYSDDAPAIVEIFSTYLSAAEALTAVARHHNLIHHR